MYPQLEVLASWFFVNSSIRVNLEQKVVFSLFLEWPQASLEDLRVIPEVTPKRVKIQYFAPNSLEFHSKFTPSRVKIFTQYFIESSGFFSLYLWFRVKCAWLRTSPQDLQPCNEGHQNQHSGSELLPSCWGTNLSPYTISGPVSVPARHYETSLIFLDFPGIRGHPPKRMEDFLSGSTH